MSTAVTRSKLSTSFNDYKEKVRSLIISPYNPLLDTGLRQFDNTDADIRYVSTLSHNPGHNLSGGISEPLADPIGNRH